MSWQKTVLLNPHSILYLLHKVAVQKLVCCKCHWMSVPSVDSSFEPHPDPDLVKMQTEIAAVESYSKNLEVATSPA